MSSLPPSPAPEPAHDPSRVPPRLRKYVDRLERSFPVAVGKRFVDVDVLTQAASVSFYALLSMAPLLVLLLWLTASLYPPAQQALIGQINDVAGSSAATVADTVLKNADNQPSMGSLAGMWSTLLLFIGATAVFAQLQNALNLIFNTSGERLDGIVAWLRKRVFSFGVVLALGFLLILSMTATTMLQVAFAQLPSVLPAVGYLTSLLLYTVGFAFLYHYLPDRRVAWRQAFIGGGDHLGAVRAGPLCHRAVHRHGGAGQRLRLDGRAGDLAGVDLLRHGGVLRGRADDGGDRRAPACPRAPGRGRHRAAETGRRHRQLVD